MNIQSKLDAIEVMINRSIFNQVCFERELSTIPTLNDSWTQSLKKKLEFQKQVTIRLGNYKKSIIFQYGKLLCKGKADN